MPKDIFNISHKTRCHRNTLEKEDDHGIFLEFLKGSDQNYLLSDKLLTISVKLYKARKYSWLEISHGIRKVSHSLSTGKQEVSYLFSQIMHICCFFDQNSDQNSRKILWTSALADRRVDEISSEFFKISWQKKSRWSQLSGFLETKRPHMYLFDKMGNLGHGK